jgi:hypothetical protein
MAILAPRAGMELHVEDKTVHPFFEKRLSKFPAVLFVW